MVLKNEKHLPGCIWTRQISNRWIHQISDHCRLATNACARLAANGSVPHPMGHAWIHRCLGAVRFRQSHSNWHELTAANSQLCSCTLTPSLYSLDTSSSRYVTSYCSSSTPPPLPPTHPPTLLSPPPPPPPPLKWMQMFHQPSCSLW